MPRFDGTGPMGQGAMTGGGRGYCAVNICEAGVRQGVGCGFSGRGNRFRGRSRNCFYTAGLPGWMKPQRGIQAFGGFGSLASKDDELAILKDQAGYLKDELDAVQTRVQDLEDKKEEEK
ncbi:MAG: DUF5320 domain-containing protein [Candidatus Omnitrophota bacterium]